MGRSQTIHSLQRLNWQLRLMKSLYRMHDRPNRRRDGKEKHYYSSFEFYDLNANLHCEAKVERPKGGEIV